MRRLRYNGRKIAAFGEAVAAAGITAAATLAAARMGASAASDSAKIQANAVQQSANINANALKEQNANTNELQKQSQNFTKSQNDENRQIQKDTQMMLQMIAGKEGVADREKASMYRYAMGGSPQHTFSLRGSNMPFHVTDGGGVIHVGTTPEGFNLYELYGNDHEHYHKVRGGKAKTGVGIKFANGDEVEGEGNQGSSSGEFLLTTPEGGYFISKHSIAGFNPAKAVRQGMHPALAFQKQEFIKDMNGISDDGKHNSSPVKKIRRRLRLAGGEANYIMAQYFPQGLDLSTDTTTATSTGVAYALQNQEQQLKNGGCSRRTLGRRKAYSSGGFGNWLNNNAQWLGAGITGLGNFGGALINMWGNNSAAGILSDAYTKASQITTNAYKSMKGIDMSALKRSDYAAQHYIPVIRSANYNINPELADVERRANKRKRLIGSNTLSSAAMLARYAKIDDDTTATKNKLYGEKYNKEEAIKQENAKRLSEAAEKNAELDNIANNAYAKAYLDLLQYNNNIENQKIAGIADAQSGALTQSAGVYASAKQANAQTLGNALANTSLGFANTLSATAKQKQDRNNIMLGASNDAYYRNLMMNGSNSEKAAAVAQLDKLIANSNGETKKQYETWRNMLV